MDKQSDLVLPFVIPRWLLSYFFLSLFHSAVCFLAYAWDKRQAHRHGMRVSEHTLHTLELLGGWPGAWVAQNVFRHKNRKLSYQFTYRLIVALHLTTISLLCYKGQGRWR